MKRDIDRRKVVGQLDHFFYIKKAKYYLTTIFYFIIKEIIYLVWVGGEGALKMGCRAVAHLYNVTK